MKPSLNKLFNNYTKIQFKAIAHRMQNKFPTFPRHQSKSEHMAFMQRYSSLLWLGLGLMAHFGSLHLFKKIIKLKKIKKNTACNLKHMPFSFSRTV